MMMSISGALQWWGVMASWVTPLGLFCVFNLIVATIYVTSSFMNNNTNNNNNKIINHHHHHQHDHHQILPTQTLLHQFHKVVDHDDHDHDRPVHLLRLPSGLLERVQSLSFSRRHTVDDEHLPQPSQQQEKEEKRMKDGVEVEADKNDETARSDFLTSPSPPEEHTAKLFRVPSLLERLRSMSFTRRRADELQAPADQTQQEEEISDHDDGNCNNTAGKVKQSKMKKSESARMGSVAAAAVKAEERVEMQRPATVRVMKKTKWDESASSDSEDEAVDERADDFINRFRQQLKLQRIDSILRRRGLAR